MCELTEHLKGGGLSKFKTSQGDRTAIEVYEKFFNSVMQSGVSREVWTIALLDKIDEAYVKHLHPHRHALGRWTDSVWVQAIRLYWEEVESVCWTGWQERIAWVNKSAENDVNALCRAPEKLRWVRYLATSGWTFMLPLPTATMISDVRDAVLAIDKGIFLVSVHISVHLLQIATYAVRRVCRDLSERVRHGIYDVKMRHTSGRPHMSRFGRSS